MAYGTSCQLIGFLLNAGFFGVLSIQIHHYFISFPNDKTYLKLLVGGVYLLEIAQTIIAVCDAYTVFATRFGDTANLAAIRTGWIYSPLLGGIMIFTVQMFYAHRINALYNSRKLGLVIVGLSVCQFVMIQISAVFVKMGGLYEVEVAVRKTYIVVMTCMVIAFVCDTTIAICMTLWLLRVYWENGSNARTHNIITTLLRTTVGNGIIIAVGAITEIALEASTPGRLLYPMIAVTLPKWYSMTLLGSLNNRSDIQCKTHSMIGETVGMEFQAATRTNINTLPFPELPVPTLSTASP
ncbi:hypothetical protein BD779DRAFT_929518 [Infundibulicybe gibba]|nr:hypothetical protein BD779DRAFT_929518 [Infundibulicybe gibba]